MKVDFHLFTCGFTNVRTHGHIPISLISVTPNVVNDYELTYLTMVKVLGFDTEAEYVDSYPGKMQRDTEICRRVGITVDVNTPTLCTKILNTYAYRYNSCRDNGRIKVKLIKDFEDENLQLISTPKTSDVVLCTNFNRVGCNNLWYCSDWGG